MQNSLPTNKKTFELLEWTPARVGSVSPCAFITARDMKNYDNSMCLMMYGIRGEYRYAENNVQ